MKGLSALERVILECIGTNSYTYNKIQSLSGLQETVCFNILQTLLIRGIINYESGKYQICLNFPSEIIEELNGSNARRAESVELIEAIIEQESNKFFTIKKISMDEKDEKIFLAMLSNLETFLKESHKKSHSYTDFKNRKIIFWGMSGIEQTINQIIKGKTA